MCIQCPANTVLNLSYIYIYLLIVHFIINKPSTDRPCSLRTPLLRGTYLQTFVTLRRCNHLRTRNVHFRSLRLVLPTARHR